MADELLPYYERELSYIRRLATQFAQAHPKIAARLRLGAEINQGDPHVERLIDSFAYLTARIRHKLDDEFPELTESLLGVLYPHYQAPIPSMAIVQFELDAGQNEATEGHVVPRHTMLETEPIAGEPCRFRTSYPVTLHPIEVTKAALMRPPFKAPDSPWTRKAACVLQLTLACRARAIRFADLNLGALRFFLKGQPQHVFRLYELLFNHAQGMALANSAGDREAVQLGPERLLQVGFEREEGLLDYPPRSFLGYRLLSEFFAFPQKFLFFDVSGLDRRNLARIGNQLEVFVYFDAANQDVEQNLDADMFRLGCTPMVNLFTREAEPIQLGHTQFEYHVVPDARRPRAHEVYSIDRVTATSPEGEVQEYRPFFSVKHALDARADATFWHSSRRPAEVGEGEPDQEEGPEDSGTEVYLSLVDLGFNPQAPPDWILRVELTCLNRDLPFRLAFGGGQPRLQFTEGGALISQITCLTAPTRTFRPALKRGALWRLISHLSLGHLSLVDGKEGADALREILKLYDFADSSETRAMIDGVMAVSSRRVTGRVGRDLAAGFCRGLEVTVKFDEEKFSGYGLLVFGSVLDRFLALYCSINSFTRLIALTKGREAIYRRWPPRTGEKLLA
jgi:type VI secretion system protein ImpG